MDENRKKRNSIIMITALMAGICLIGAAVVAVTVLARRNPLAEGLAGLAKEVVTLEEEMGEDFWTNAVNRIGSGDMQAEYAVNVGGVPNLQNMTVGLDGTVKRDMGRQLFETDMQISVANAKITEASVFGTTNTLYLQIPSIWDGSVVMEAYDLDGQWNTSAAKKQLQLLAGRELAVNQDVDADFMRSFSVKSFSFTDFLRENAEALENLYKNMEVMKVEKAEQRGYLSKEQAEALENNFPEDAGGNRIKATCYLAVLPKEELQQIFNDNMVDIRLGVYLDSKKRIVRICTIPEEVFVTEAGEGELSLELTGEEATIDRLKLTVFYESEGKKTDTRLSGKVETDTVLSLGKETKKKGSYHVLCDSLLTYGENKLGFSMAGSVQGEQTDNGESVFLDVENLTIKARDKVVCRFSGKAAFKPLTENIEIPDGKEYHIGEMSEIETLLFLTECTGNLYKNYSGYLKLLQ